MFPCESSSSSTRLAPGFRFHPTDEELVSYYLKRKISGLPLRVDAIAEIDLYKKEPWELPSLSKLQTRDKEWYFFSPLDRKDYNRMRTSRGTMEGYWKTTGKDRAVRNTYSNVVVGMKKTLVFHEGRAPKGKRTNWVMHEYRLESSENDATSSCENTTLVHPLDSFVVCRIFQKHGNGPQNGAQYGAPFIAEEWEGIQDNKIPECLESHGNGHDAALMCLTNEQYYAELDVDLQNQILENHQDNNESTNSKDCQCHADEQTQYQLVDNLVADHPSEEQVCDTDAYDILFTLEDLIDFDKPNTIDGNLQEDDVCIDGNTTRNSSIASDKSDGHLELNDVYANANCANTTFEDCIRSNHANNANTSLKIEDTEIFNNSDATIATEGVQNMQPYDYLNHTDVNYLEDGAMFHDAPSNDVQFTEDTYMNINEFKPTITDFDLVDDLMAYFDTTEQDFGFSRADQSDINNPKIISEVAGSYYPTGKEERMETLGTNIGTGASTTKFIDAAANPLENTNVQANEGWNKSFRKHVVGMLGSMSAPPAMAAADSCKGKGIQISNSGSSSIRVSAGVIQIRGISVTGHPEKWTLSKDGEISFIYTYANGAVCKLASHQPPGATAFGMLLRSGIFLFGFSALVLSVTMKLGVGLYRK